MLANVLSWWGSRLGGSAPITASRTPPRRGVSAAWTVPGHAATSDPRRRARARRETKRGRFRRGAAVMGYLPRMLGRSGGRPGRRRNPPAMQDVEDDLAFETYALPRAWMGPAAPGRRPRTTEVAPSWGGPKRSRTVRTLEHAEPTRGYGACQPPIRIKRACVRIPTWGRGWDTAGRPHGEPRSRCSCWARSSPAAARARRCLTGSCRTPYWPR